MFKKEDESGQSILIIALSVLAILALIALVVDVGNAYAHRRKVQNAVDAAALAGARQLAFRDSRPADAPLMIPEVFQVVGDYAEANGVSRDDVEAVFVKAEGDWKYAIDNSPAPVPKQAEGVSVKGYLPFPTYFAHMLGFPTMEVNADAQAYITSGPCSCDGCLFPLVVSIDTWPGSKPVVGEVYKLWDQTLLTAGNFGWAYWVDEFGTLRGEPPQGPEVTSLEPNLETPCRSGPWEVGEKVHGDNGVNFQPVLDILETYITSPLTDTVVIPIYDFKEDVGSNSLFRIAGFGAFKLLCAHSSQAHYVEYVDEEGIGYCGIDETDPGDIPDTDKYLTGMFVEWLETSGFEDGCIDTGITGVSFRPPKSGWMPEWTED